MMVFLPGTVADNGSANFREHGWMVNEMGFRDGGSSKRMRGTSRKGIISRAKTQKVFIDVPSLAEGVWNSGVGSNGLFDYVSFKAFSGAKIDFLPSKAYYPPSESDQVVYKKSMK